MTWQTLDNKQKILQLIYQLISDRVEIKIRAKGEKTAFTSKFIKISQDNILSEIGKKPELIIESLSPAKGNSLIQSLPEVDVEFLINQSLCRCTLEYIGISSTHPYFGFILSFPEAMEIEEKRREERFVYELSEFISVEFRLGNKSKEGKLYELNVFDCSKYGIGLIIPPKDFALLRILHKGDRLEDISFFSSWAFIKVNGTVSHITKIQEGKYKGCYILGIDSPDIIESCKPVKN